MIGRTTNISPSIASAASKLHRTGQTAQEYSPDASLRQQITGIPVADIEKLTHQYAGRSGPAADSSQPASACSVTAAAAMAVRAITCLPAIIGAWRHAGGGALLSTSKLYPFDTNALERPDLIPRGTRTINMTQLAEALLGELPGPPVKALYVYNSNPAAVCPDQSRVLKGLRREDLFTVVHEQFQTDTADYADIVLPATTQLEHFDIHNSYGHMYVQANEPAIAPLFEAKSNTDVFRLLAAKMGFEAELFQVSDEALAEESLQPLVFPASTVQARRPHSRAVHRYPPQEAFVGISLERLKREGPVRLNLPKGYMPFAEGNFGTPSGKCELYSPGLEARGANLDPLPNYTPPHEDPQTRPDLAAKYPLQMLSPPVPSFLNSTFVNVDSLRHKRRANRRWKVAPVRCVAAARETANGSAIFNDRGSFQARAIVARNGEARRGRVAKHLVESLCTRRRQLQHDDEHRIDLTSARGRDVF